MTYYFSNSLYTPRRSLTARPLRKWMGLEDDPAFLFGAYFFFGENLAKVFHFQGSDLTLEVRGLVKVTDKSIPVAWWMWIFFGVVLSVSCFGCFVLFFFFRFYFFEKLR